jgi:hypothetical protein
MKTLLSKTGTLYFISATITTIGMIFCDYFFNHDSFFRFDLFSTFYLFIATCFLIVSLLGFLPYYFIALRINGLSSKMKRTSGLIIAISSSVIFLPFFKENTISGIVLVIIFSSGISFFSNRIAFSKDSNT